MHGRAELSPQLVGCPWPDALEQLHDPLKRDLVLRIGNQLQVSDNVLHVRLLEETNSTGDAERDLAFGQLELQFECMEMRSIQHGHIVHADAFVAKLQNAMCYE